MSGHSNQYTFMYIIILLTDTQGRFGRQKRNRQCEDGSKIRMMWPQAKENTDSERHNKLDKTRSILPQCFQREHAPAVNLTLDLASKATRVCNYFTSIHQIGDSLL